MSDYIFILNWYNWFSGNGSQDRIPGTRPLGEKCLLFCVKYSVCWPVKSFDIGEQQQNQQQVIQFQNIYNIMLCTIYNKWGYFLTIKKLWLVLCNRIWPTNKLNCECAFYLIMMCLYSWAKSSCYLLFS